MKKLLIQDYNLIIRFNWTAEDFARTIKNMSVLTKGLILLIFLVVIFGQNLFPTRALYWSAYFVMFALVPLLWFINFWVSQKSALKALQNSNETNTKDCTLQDMKNSFFAGMVPVNTQEDLIRGRLCFIGGNIILIGRKGRKSVVTWQAKISDITSVGFGTVAGVRRGFTVYLNNGEKSFTSMKVFKHREILYDALGWKIKTEDKS